jgi:hypothetical protein
MNIERTIVGVGTPANDNMTRTSEGRQLYAAALQAAAKLAVYAKGRGNDELRARAETALDALLAGQFAEPIEIDNGNRAE